MKFKKLGMVAALVVSAVALTACGTDNKAQFIKDNAELAKASTQKFNLKMDNLKVIASGDAKSYVPIINGYLSSVEFSGKSMTDGKNAQVTMDVSLAGQEIPLEVVTKDTDAYVKLETLKPVLDMYLQSSGAGVASMGLDMTKIKGKYLDLTAISEENAKETEAVSSLDVKEAKKALDKAYNSLDKTDFSKDGSAITMTLSGDQLAKFIKTYLSALPEKSKESFDDLLKDKDFDKELPKVIKALSITTDSKNKTSNVVVKFTGKEVEGYGLDGQISYKTTYSNGKVTVKIPAKGNLIKTTEELTGLISNSVQAN
ncbi:lipoprotein [Bacilli bacterium]|nr:lipoprotein [Bacilli bacterium]